MNIIPAKAFLTRLLPLGCMLVAFSTYALASPAEQNPASQTSTQAYQQATTQKNDEKITFSADLPLDSYQPRTIIAKLSQAFALSGIEFAAIKLPSDRSLSLAHQGIIDGEISRVGNLHEITNNKYSNLIKIDHKMLSVWISVFAKKDNIVINELADIGKYTVCYINGRKLFDNVFEPLIKPRSLIKLNGDNQAFEMLEKDRVDIVITTHREGQDLIRDYTEFQQIKEVKKLIELPIYSYIHKKHKHLLAELVVNLDKIDPLPQPAQ